MADRQIRLAYLTSQYPATSHTFIRREVEALRELGLRLDTFSIRFPAQSELSDPAIAADAASTFTVLKQPLGSFLAAHLAALFTQPVAYVRTFARALGHRPPGLRGFGLALAHFGEAILLSRELRRRGITRLHNHFANTLGDDERGAHDEDPKQPSVHRNWTVQAHLQHGLRGGFVAGLLIALGEFH